MSEAIKEKNSELIAQRWAKALIDLANEMPDVTLENVMNDLELVNDTISSSNELSNVLNNPAISTEDKKNVLSKIFYNKINSMVYNFIFTLNLKKRLNLISLVVDAYKKELDKVQNVSHVLVTSAIELNDEKKNYIQNKLSEKLQKNVVLNWDVDNEIIAGLKFDIDSTIIDNSVKHKLDSIKKKITKVNN